MSEFHHVSVLLEECIEGLAIKPNGIYVDGTLGGAGHSSRIAAKLTTGRLIGIDRDNVALEAAAERLKPYEDRVTLVHANFCDMDEALEKLGIDKVDGILLDLGVSSPQLDDGQRGFSYMTDAPLDMRMNGEDVRDARQIVNTWSYEELKRLVCGCIHAVIFCMITARSALRPGSPRPFAAAGSRRPSRRRWSWWT